MKRVLLLSLLLLNVALTTDAATRASEASAAGKAPIPLESRPQPPNVPPTTVSALGPGQSVASEVIAVAPVEPEIDKDNVYWRRPSADDGLRYSSNDWFTNFLTTPLSFTLRRIKFHLLSNVAVSAFAIFMYSKYPEQTAIPMTGHSLLGSSLGLLLSYRTNSAYGRFWEARGHWTTTKADCRNLAVLMKTHVAAHSPKASERFLFQLSAFPGALMFLCLGGAARLPDYVQKHLPAERTHLYMDQSTLPAMELIMELQYTLHEAMLESKTSKSNLVEAAHLSVASHLVDGLMTKLSNCEKILKTPVPWTYSRHTSRFLTLWLGTLPYALVGNMKPWLVLAIVVSASYCMLGIEEIGHLIEQPFLGDPLDGDEKIWSTLDGDGEASALIKRGLITQPYDIGIPVCSLASQIRQEVQDIAAAPSRHPHHHH